MKIGVRGHDYGCAAPRELARRISDAGFCCFQLALHKAISGFAPQLGLLNPGICSEIKNAFEDRRLEVAVLGCYIDPACQDEKKRDYDVRRFLEHIAYCRPLGSSIVATETSSCTEEDRQVQYKLLVESVKRMVEQAEKFGVFVGIEPVLKHTLNTPELARKLLDEVNSLNLKIVLDPINLLSPDNIERQNEIIDECFELFGTEIAAVHAKDVTIEDGAFKPCVIGTGLFDHEYFYRKLNCAKPGIAVLREEAKPETAHLDIAALKKYALL
ncbi:MAG: sugar phosphate isomerase/epimerase [Clostridia bacterium]|nr:sugar phosphate isomerase/epimerase [Clostridia bacterium]